MKTLIKKIKILIAALIIVFQVCVVPSYGFVPILAMAAYVTGAELAPWAVASLAIHVAGAAALLVYNMTPRSSSDTKITPSGDISRSAKITWVDLVDSKPVVKEASVSAKVQMNDVQSIVTPNQSQYPKLENAINKSSIPDIDLTSKPGDIVNIGGIGYRKIISVSAETVTCKYTGSLPSSYTVGNTYYMKRSGGSLTCGTGYISFVEKAFTFDNGSYTASRVPKTPTEWKNTVDPTGTNMIADDFKGEIDDLIHSNPNIVHFEDTDGASSTDNNPPLVPPKPMDPSNVDKVNSRNAAAASSSAAAQSASAAASAARTASNTARANANANPGDMGLEQKAQDAEAAAAAAEAAAAGAAATAARDSAAASEAASEAKNETEQEALPGSGSPSPLTEIDWTPLTSLAGTAANVFPFNQLSSIAGYYSMLTQSPSPPVFTVSLPLGKTLTIDLTPWDSIAAIARFIVSLVVSVGMLFFVIKFWRGVS